jgi:Arc/MetJ family transcription regulator
MSAKTTKQTVIEKVRQMKHGKSGKRTSRLGRGMGAAQDAMGGQVVKVHVPRKTKQGHERMQLMVDPRLLDAAVVSLGAKTKSEAVNVALRNAAENAAILQGLDDAMGSIPDFPYVET